MSDKHGTEELAISSGQVMNQLERILSSSLYEGGDGHRRKTSTGSLLRFLVEQRLSGRHLTDRIVVEEFYQQTYQRVYPDTNTIARSNIGNLRADLEKYYATIGLMDPVLITIPLRQANPKFQPNPRSLANQQAKKGFYHTHRESPEDVIKAIKNFDEAIALDDKFADAYAGKGAAILTRPLHHPFENESDALDEAEVLAQKAIELDDKSLRGHVVLGAVYLYRHDWKRAETEFGRAKEIDALELYEDGGYGPFLIARGKRKEAEELVQLYLSEYNSLVVFLNRAGLYLYGLRKYEEARTVLQSVLDLDEHFWQAHLILGFVHLAIGDYEKAMACANRIEPLIRSTVWPGFYNLCLAMSGRAGDAQEGLASLLATNEIRYVHPLQIALSYMAVDRPLEAIEFVSGACEKFDPFTAWLHVYALLDPLRGYPQFQKILSRWGYPRVDLI